MTNSEHFTLFTGLRNLGDQIASLLHVQLTPGLQSQLAEVWPLAGTATLAVQDYQPTAGDGAVYGPCGSEIRYLAGTGVYLCKFAESYKLATESDLNTWLLN
jgi:hypothetical protein